MTAPYGSWDAEVRAHPRASYLQTSSWATAKASNGWRRRIVGSLASPAGPAAQVLLRRLPIVPRWFAYAPRGPLAEPWTTDTVDAWTDAAKRDPGLRDVTVLRIDPEVEATEASEPIVARLVERGWQPAPDVQPRSTRIVDLHAGEASLWSDLRSKWRQYVKHAQRSHVTVREVDPVQEPEAFPTFHDIMTGTAARAGIPLRTALAYRELWAAFRASGESSLLFADDEAGQAQAVLMLVRCGSHVVEPYGGMTERGAELRANYLLKWEAIRRSQRAGAATYDMWGLVHPGIAQFKQGFGGRDVHYIGAWDLVLDPIGGPAFRLAERTRRRLRRLLRGRDGETRPTSGPA